MNYTLYICVQWSALALGSLVWHRFKNIDVFFFCFLSFHFCFCYCQFCVWCLCLCALLKRFVYAGAQCVCVYWAHVNEYDTRIYWMWINKFTRMRKCRTMTIEIFGILMRAVALVMEGLANSPITSSTSLHVLASDQSIISLIRNVFSFFFVPAKWNFWVISNAYTRRRSLKKHKSGAIDQQTVWLCENVTRTSTAFRLDQTSLMLRDCYLVTHWWDSMKCVSVSTCWSFLALCDNLRVISVPV